MFYNTGIGTYLWVLANKKEDTEERKSAADRCNVLRSRRFGRIWERRIQRSPRRSGKGSWISTPLLTGADSRYSKVFRNEEFGCWEVPVYTPRIDENGQPILDKKGKPVKPDLDKEIVPFSYEGGIDAFTENEVLPFSPLAYIKPGTEKIGYEISYTKYFISPCSCGRWTKYLRISGQSKRKQMGC